MAYIPPHKRHSSTQNSATPRQDFRPCYARNCISRWFPAGPDGRPVTFDHIKLQPFPCESIERKYGSKPMAIVHNPTNIALHPLLDVAQEEPPWVFLSKRILPDIIEASKNAREETCSNGEHIKMAFSMKVGKNLFPRDSNSLSHLKKAVSDQDVRIRKNFQTTMPNEYLENLARLLPLIGFPFWSEQEKYRILVLDKKRPNIIIWCTCKIRSDGTLQLYKAVSSLLRYLVADASFLYKDFDLRVALKTTKNLNFCNGEEKDEIHELIGSAVLDPNMKGGMRWLSGRKSLGGRFECIKLWQLKARKFKGPSGCFDLRNSKGFNYQDSYAEFENEVTLKLSEVSKLLRDDIQDWEILQEMVQDSIKIFWNHILKANVLT